MGGTERQFLLGSAALSGHYEVHLGCMVNRGSFSPEVRHIHEFDTGNSMASMQAVRAGGQLARFLRQKRITVAHAFDVYSNLLMIPAARAAGIPIVIGAQRQLGDLLAPLQQIAQSAMFNLADAVICNSQAAANRLRRRGMPARKLFVIPNYVPEAAFAEVEPALALTRKKVRIGMVARINSAAKNHALLLRSFAVLAHRYEHLELVLAGDGPLRAEYEALTRNLGIANRVLFLGERRDITAVMRSLDIVVLTSNSESLSNAILEAMAASRPVVASNVGGNGELIAPGENGLLFARGSVEELVGALEVMITSPTLRAQMGAKGRERARRDFSCDRIAQQTRECYEGLMQWKIGWRSSSQMAVV